MSLSPLPEQFSTTISSDVVFGTSSSNRQKRVLFPMQNNTSKLRVKTPPQVLVHRLPHGIRPVLCRVNEHALGQFLDSPTRTD